MTKEPKPPDDARYLILMRHAKSDWNDESLSDHDRPLNRRGRRDAPNMARWLADQNLIPDLMLVSSSQRTRETAALMLAIWNSQPDTEFSDDLYHGSPEEIIAAVQCDGNDRQRVMVVAHNPGMTSLVSHFADEFTEMPTAAIAIFQPACDSWNDLGPGTSMRLVETKRPKELI